MTEPKKPQDRKPKVETVDGVSSVTIDGVRVSVAKDAMDDFELLDDLQQMQDGQGGKITSVARRLFGEQYQDVIKALRGDDARLSVEKASAFVGKVLEAIAPNS